MTQTVTQKTKTVKPARHSSRSVRLRLNIPPRLAARLRRLAAFDGKTTAAHILTATKAFVEAGESEMQRVGSIA